MRKKLLLAGGLKMLSGLLVMRLLLFVPAGTWRYPGGWRLMALLFVPMPVVGVVLYVKAPELLEKRLNSREQEPEQKRIILLFALVFVAGFVLAGMDFHFGWTRLPKAVVVAGCVLFCGAYGLYAEVMRENAWLSRTVEVQEGQQVVDTGLYGVVRHPMYLGVLVLFLSMPLVLGSAVAVVPFLAIPWVLVQRIRNEEQVLETGLPGYGDYRKKVKYRLIPFLW